MEEVKRNDDDVLQQMMQNFRKRLQQCLSCDRRHIEHYFQEIMYGL
jgi:hypothetical protein